MARAQSVIMNGIASQSTPVQAKKDDTYKMFEMLQAMLEVKFNEVKSDFNVVNKRLDTIDAKFNEISNDINNRFDIKFNELKNDIHEQKSECGRNFDKINRRLDINEVKIDKLINKRTYELIILNIIQSRPVIS